MFIWWIVVQLFDIIASDEPFVVVSLSNQSRSIFTCIAYDTTPTSADRCSRAYFSTLIAVMDLPLIGDSVA